MFVLNEDPRSKKRQRDTDESVPKDSPEDPPSAKRRTRTSEAGTYQWHRPPSFWNRLSKVHLSRGALREFDRRTSRAEQRALTLHSSINTSSRPGTKSVKRFSRHGGPDLSHIRGFAILADQGDAMSPSNSSRKRSSASSGSGATSKTGKSSYDPNFEQNLIDGGIYPHNRGSKPNNAKDIRDDMAKPRASLSPSRFGDEDFNAFVDLCDRAGDEATVRAEIISIIAGESRKQYNSAADRQFNHLEPLAEDLPKPVPDLYDGAFPQQINQRVRRDLGKHIIPSNNTSLPAAPNFFLEGKSAGGRADVAKRQACYDGAVGARAMHSLQNYQVVEPIYDGNATSYSATYHQGTATLQLYTHHLTAPKAPGEPPECHMTQLDGFQMTGNRETFVKGAAGFRHNRDRAKTDRDNFIERANQKARGAPADTPSTTLTDSRTSRSVLQEEESDTSPDELVAERTTAKRTRHATVGQPTHAAMPLTAAPFSTRYLSHELTTSRQPPTGAHCVQSNPRPRASIKDGKPRRQIRPTQKVLDSTYVDGFRERRR
ncbi:hypothetical protein AYO21_11558 [Fonsecaea monophora]|uniref:Uncharacterized protein n=1 Tax=Fonsecaea monophora TaxID=254056 RepID=A0A177ERJ7_9EURO|nr:hypothetical protein AYO21_11558 [Fonsecaea monophora]OAG34276.1 hypothetical protein AYO21_11558 [Fonsecaea monophora]